jgi:hypothetical protein
LSVISEFLRTQQGVNQVDHEHQADEQNADVLKIHLSASFQFFASRRVGDCDGEKYERQQDHEKIEHQELLIRTSP